MPIEPGLDGTTYLENGATAGDPVQTFSGALLYSHTDLAIAGRGPSPVFTRSYNSADTRVGPLGPGWTHSYNARLRDPGDGTGDLLFVRADGNTDRFTRNNDETFSPSPATYATLVRNADLSYTVTELDQRRWTFDRSGRLTAVTDRYGNASVLAYDASGRLSTVADPAGRGVLTFTYTNNLLTGVTDWLTPARTVTYGYDGSGRLRPSPIARAGRRPLLTAQARASRASPTPAGTSR
jgi:YD repeat-containing protein